MTSPKRKRTSIPTAAITGLTIFGLAIYLFVAQIFGLVPFRAPAPAACPSTAANYQIFVDPTGSNQHTDNWKTEAHALAQTLGPCDRATFYAVGSNTAAGAAIGTPLVLPIPDANASGGERLRVVHQIAALRAETEQRIERMMTQPGSARSDIIGIFSKLTAAPGMRNILVVFSDGQESAGPLNLEDGHQCVGRDNVQALVSLALPRMPFESAVGRFDSVKWIIPAQSGRLGCNSRELALFWRAVIARLSGTGKPPALTFETNIFSLGGQS
jgi:hypothetical protein